MEAGCVFIPERALRAVGAESYDLPEVIERVMFARNPDLQAQLLVGGQPTVRCAAACNRWGRGMGLPAGVPAAAGRTECRHAWFA